MGMSEGIIIAIIGLFSVIISQTLAETLKKLFSKAKEKADVGTAFRDELRKEIDRKDEEIAELRKEVRFLEGDKDRWRVDYFKIYQAFFELKALAVSLTHRLGEASMEIPQLPERSTDHVEDKES